MAALATRGIGICEALRKRKGLRVCFVEKIGRSWPVRTCEKEAAGAVAQNKKLHLHWVCHPEWRMKPALLALFVQRKEASMSPMRELSSASLGPDQIWREATSVQRYRYSSIINAAQIVYIHIDVILMRHSSLEVPRIEAPIPPLISSQATPSSYHPWLLSLSLQTQRHCCSYLSRLAPARQVL